MVNQEQIEKCKGEDKVFIAREVKHQIPNRLKYRTCDIRC